MQILLLTGPKHSGKTTWLQNFVTQNPPVGGILSPVVNGQRMFLDIQTKEVRKMEAFKGEENTLQIGKYTFSGAAFEWAIQKLESAVTVPRLETLVIDEIGPLELNGLGFDEFLKATLQNTNLLKLLLVVREELVNEVIAHYKLHHYPVSFLSASS